MGGGGDGRGLGDVGDSQDVEVGEGLGEAGRAGYGAQRVAAGHEESPDVAALDLVDQRGRGSLTEPAGEVQVGWPDPGSGRGTPGRRRGRRKPGLNHTPPGRSREPVTAMSAQASHSVTSPNWPHGGPGARVDRHTSGGTHGATSAASVLGPHPGDRRGSLGGQRPDGAGEARAADDVAVEELVVGALGQDGSRTTSPRIAQSVPGRGARWCWAIPAVSVTRTSRHHSSPRAARRRSRLTGSGHEPTWPWETGGLVPTSTVHRAPS